MVVTQLALADTHAPSPPVTSIVYSAPPRVGDSDPLAGPNLDPIFEPLARHLFVRHFALEHGLVRGLHCQIRNVLQDLQLFHWMRREGEGAVTTPVCPQTCELGNTFTSQEGAMKPEGRWGRAHRRTQGSPGGEDGMCKGPVEQSRLVGVGTAGRQAVVGDETGRAAGARSQGLWPRRGLCVESEQGRSCAG